MEVSEREWATINDWWDTLVDTQSLVRTPKTARLLDDRWWDSTWAEEDRWWETYLETHSMAHVSRRTMSLDSGWTDGEWSDLDPWWDTYGDATATEVAELQVVLEEVTNQWAQSESRFDDDPLAVNWTSATEMAGPLRPNQEENWSQWLAHLLRSSTGPFLVTLFGKQFDTQPEHVRREIHLPDPSDSDRYADILVFDKTRGISIEVKKGDEHYGKTAHTAGLVESQYSREWTHYLLLPRFKIPALRADSETTIVDPDDGRPRIKSEQSNDIETLYWEDVSSALRRLLLTDREANPHWDASAYLFCSLIEQHILQFNPRPLVEQRASGNPVLHRLESLSVAIGDVEEQIQYLTSIQVDDNHE